MEDKLRSVLEEIQQCIEQQNGATEGQLKSIWNDLSDAINEKDQQLSEVMEFLNKVLIIAINDKWMDDHIGRQHVYDTLKRLISQQTNPEDNKGEQP